MMIVQMRCFVYNKIKLRTNTKGTYILKKYTAYIKQIFYYYAEKNIISVGINNKFPINK